MAGSHSVSAPPRAGAPGDGAPPRGWYPDPSRDRRIRFWDGRSWTSAVADLSEPPALDAPVLQAELLAFLASQRTRGADIDRRLDQNVPAYVTERCRLSWNVGRSSPAAGLASPLPAAQLREPGAPLAPAMAEGPSGTAGQVTGIAACRPVRPGDRATIGPSPQVRPLGPVAASAPRVRLPAPIVRPPARPSVWERVRRAVVSDLTLHGLAYLGVLLVFAGIFGLLVFSWGEVGRDLRPVAELAVPLALLGAGAALSRRGSQVVGRALTLLGAAVLPFVAIAAVADGSPIPPDAHGRALVACAALVFLGSAVGYGVVVARRPDSPVAYLVAPAVWLGVGMVALAPRADAVVGRTVAGLSSGQVAAVLAAVATTAWLARARPGHRLARPTLVVSIPGLAVFGVIAIVLGAEEAWPVGAIALASCAVVLGLEAVAPVLPGTVVGMGQVLGAGAAVAVVGTVVEPAWSAALGVAVFCTVLDWEGIRRPGPSTLLMGATAIGVALAVSTIEPWAGVTAFGVGTVWAAGAYARPRPWLPSTVAAASAALLPIGVAVGLFRAIDAGPAAAITAAAVAGVAVAAWVARTSDPLLRWWVPIAAVAATLLPLPLVSAAPDGWLAVTAALGTVALAAAPVTVDARIWLCGAGLVEAGAFVSIAFEVRPGWSAVVLAAAGVLAVGAAIPRIPHSGQVGLAGHVGTIAAVAVAGTAGGMRGWPVSLSASLAVAALFVTAWYQERGAAPATDLLVRWLADGDRPASADHVRAAVPALAIAGLPAVTVSVLDTLGVLVGAPATAGLVLAIAAVVLAAGTWIARDRPLLALPAAVVGVITGLGGIGLTVTEPIPATVAGGLLAVACLAVHPSVRRVPMTWIGAAATGYAAVRAGQALGVADDRLCLVLLGWASIVLVGSLALDRKIAGERTAPGWVRVGALEAPAALAGIAVPVGLLLSFQLDPTTWGWSAVAVAFVAIGVAGLTGAGMISAGFWALLCVGGAGLAPFDVLDEPLAFVGAASLMASASFLIERRGPRSGWANWDLAPLVVGSVTALVGIVAAVPGEVAPTWLAGGVLAIAIAIWRRQPAWAAAGVVLLNGAAVDGGRGWLTLSLALTSVAATAGAVRSAGTARSGLRLAGVAAAIGAVEVFLLDTGRMSTTAELTTSGVMTVAIVGGLGLLVLGVAARAARLDRPWVVPWAIGSALVLVQAGPDLASVDRRPAGLAVAIGLLLAAGGSATGAAPLRAGLLRDAAVLLAAGAGVVAWWSVDGQPAALTAVLSAMSIAGAGQWVVAARRPPTVWHRPLTLALGLTAAGAPSVAWLGDAGAGWVTIGLLTLSLVATVAAATLATGHRARVPLQFVGAAAVFVGFQTLLLRVGWLVTEPDVTTTERAVVAGAVGGGLLAAALAAAARWARLGADWVIVWSAVAAGMLGQAAVGLDVVGRRPGGFAVAAGLGLCALAAALAARPLAAGPLRESAALLGVLALSVASWAAAAGSVESTAGACTLALATAGLGLWLGPARPGSPWRRPIDLVTLLGTGVALGLGLALLPARGPSVAALLTASAVAAAIGVARRILALQLAVPPLLCAAWLAAASEAVVGDPLWFTVPVGIALLAVAGIGRQQHRRLGGVGTPAPFVAIELAGCAGLLLPPLIEMVTDHVAYGLVTLVSGVVLAAWGTVTEVRRRLAAGVTAVVVTVVLLVGVPLVERLPEYRPTGVTIWLIVLAAGVVAIVLATLLERGRATIGRAVTRVGELTRGWE